MGEEPGGVRNAALVASPDEKSVPSRDERGPGVMSGRPRARSAGPAATSAVRAVDRNDHGVTTGRPVLASLAMLPARRPSSRARLAALLASGGLVVAGSRRGSVT